MKRATVLGQAVLDARRHLGVHRPTHDTIAFEGPELLREHLRRDAVERALEVGEAAHFALEEQEHDVELPPTAEERERVADVRSGAVRPEAGLTFR